MPSSPPTAAESGSTSACWLRSASCSADCCEQQKSFRRVGRLRRDELLRALDQLLRIERLANETARTALLGVGGRLLVDLAGEHDHRDRPVTLLHALEHLPAVDARHDNVEQDEVGCGVLDRSKSFVGTCRLANGVPVEGETDSNQLAQACVVVD